MDPTLPRIPTDAERASDRESAATARRWSAAHVTPEEASSTFGAVALGVALACVLCGGIAVINALHAHAGELLAMVAP